MLTVCDDDKRDITINVSFFKKVHMYNCRVGDPIPITPMHEIPEVSETYTFPGDPSVQNTHQYYSVTMFVNSSKP